MHCRRRSTSRPPIRRASARRRGVALIVVLMVVAAASVMTYGVIASATLQTKIVDAAASRAQRQYLAESGLTLADYYLRNPSSSPVSLTYGSFGNVHYPGESNISLGDMPGKLSVTVTNTANGVFNVTSAGTLDGETTTASATIKLEKELALGRAGTFLGSPTLSNKMSFNGGLLSIGSVTNNGATLVGSLLSSNGVSLGGSTVPTGTITKYPISMTYYMPYYFRDGKRYTAKRITTSSIGLTLLDTDLVNNPYNVWYADGNVSVSLVTVVPGTLVVKNGRRLTLSANLTVTPLAGMPALVTDGEVLFNGNSKTLTLNGPMVIKNQVRGSGATGLCYLIVNGALVSGASGAWTDNYNGFVNVTYDAAKSTLKGVVDEVEPVKTLTVQSWKTNNGSLP